MFDFGVYYDKKYWINKSDRCNRKTHPDWFSYQPYRRGKNRCDKCGARIGKVKCVRKTFRKSLQEAFFQPNPLYQALKDSGALS